MTTALLTKRGNYANMQDMKKYSYILGGVALAIAAAVLYLALYQIPEFGDFESDFYPAGALDNPYDWPTFLVPPWVIVLLRPFLLLPVHAAGTAWTLLSICLIVYSARELGADWLALALILFNPFTWFFVTLGQLDALVLLGFVLVRPPGSFAALDVLLLTVKPHVIGTAVLFRLREYGRKAWSMLAAAVGLSLLIWWAWPVQMLANWRVGVYHPLSLDVWPYGVPFGLALLAYAWKRRNDILGALSMYFLTPYVGPGSIVVYATLVLSTAPLPGKIAAYMVLWIVGLWLVI